MSNNWEKPYIIIRISTEGQTQIVHSCDTLKDAKYWLSYIAVAGDAIFTTPAHPKNTGSMPLYFAHLVSRGNTEHDENKWKNNFLKAVQNFVLPTSC